MKLVLNNPILMTCVIISSKTNENVVKIVDEDYYKLDDYSDYIISAKVIGSAKGLKEGQKGLVIQSNETSDSTNYFLGVTDDSSSVGNKEVPIENKVNQTKQLLTDQEYNVKVAESSFMLKDEFYSLMGVKDNKVTSSISSGSGELNLFHKKRISIESNELTYRIGNGNFIITGPSDDTAGDKADAIDKYKSINQFFVKAKNVGFDTQGGAFKYTGNLFDAKLGSSKMSTFVPGGGPSAAFNVEIVQGDADLTIGLGSVHMIAQNFKLIDSINFRVGTILHPIKSGHTMNAKQNLLYHQTAFKLVETYLDLKSGGKAELFGTNSIDVKSLAGDISLTAVARNVKVSSTMNTNIDAKMNVNIKSKLSQTLDALISITIKAKNKISMSAKSVAIEAMVDAKVKAAMINVEAKTNAIIKAKMIKLQASGMLDMSGSKMIMAGPKKVAPTGAGPFCALPSCLFTGAPHSGPMAK